MKKGKKILRVYLLLAVTVLSFSCNSDDDGNGNGNGEETSVTGTYMLSSLVPSETIDADANGSFNTSDIIGLINCDFRIVLSEDDTYTINFTEFSVYQNGSSSSGPNGVQVEVFPLECDTFSVISGTFSITDGSLILTGDDDFGQQILSISNDEITFVYTNFFWTSSDDANQNPVQFTAKFVK
ncbi:hypothetical protein [Winogradskyella sp.]|uniref:hypothetical protein n=1 Tax=Winogradskyella sp. TaxID=1883156 RepID=UPI00260C2951|nr:hypothetical protein [Winogradskyella sp.]